MRKIAILSDILANLSAFMAVRCEVDAAGADQIAVRGDIVWQRPFPEQCVDLCGQLASRVMIRSNELIVNIFDPFPFLAQNLRRVGRSH